jgi:hypothetical protein
MTSAKRRPTKLRIPRLLLEELNEKLDVAYQALEQVQLVLDFHEKLNAKIGRLSARLELAIEHIERVNEGLDQVAALRSGPSNKGNRT